MGCLYISLKVRGTFGIHGACELIFLRTYPATPLSRFSLTTYPAVPLFFFALTLLFLIFLPALQPVRVVELRVGGVGKRKIVI